MFPRETENNASENFEVINKEHYGMLWYFLEWSIGFKRRATAMPHSIHKL